MSAILINGDYYYHYYLPNSVKCQRAKNGS